MHQQSRPFHNLSNRSGYLSTDTIAAIATGLGGAVSIVRVSGPEAFTCLPSLPESPFRHLSRVKLRDQNNNDIDDALIVRFKGPESFTGEDVVEFQIHGGHFVAGRLMNTLMEAGIRQALPGEFSFRAVRNGKLSLSQAEAIADLINASNESAASLALEKLSGAQNQWIAQIALDLRQLASLGEIGIDFSDQNIDEVGLENLRKKLLNIYSKLDDLAKSFSRGSRIQRGVTTAFIGIPNAGKSSLFNSLLGEDRSIVSAFAGTTRDIVCETLTVHGPRLSVTLRMEDTAGLRNAYNPIEKEGIERAERAAKNAELLIFLIDPTQPIDLNLQQWKSLGTPGEKTIGVVSKADLISPHQKSEIERHLSGFKIAQWVFVSAITNEGLEDLTQAITQRCEKWTSRQSGEILLTRLDHFQAVKEALGHLDRAKMSNELDLFAADIRQALHSLSPIIGDTLSDDILGKIFSEFCIGK
jgi:tRNA modification GTPase